MKPEWSADWAWGVPLTALTLAIHGAVITGIAALVTRAGTAVESRRPGRTSMALIMAAAVGVLGGALAILHGLEATVWAAAYLLVGAVGKLGDGVFGRLHHRARRIGSAVAPHWKMMGALESVNGLLLFGISTAFLASVMIDVRSLQARLAQRPESEPTDSDMDR